MMSAWRQVLDTQMGQWRWTRSEQGINYLIAKIEAEMKNHTASTELRELMLRMSAAEESKLLGADPIFVSGEMCELVAAAADPEGRRVSATCHKAPTRSGLDAIDSRIAAYPILCWR